MCYHVGVKEFFRIGYLVWGIGMCVSSVVLLIVGGVMMINRVNWKEGAVPVEAVITGYVAEKLPEGDEYLLKGVNYKYTLDDKEYTGCADLVTQEGVSEEQLMQRNATVNLIPLTVLVNPAEASESRPDSFSDIYLSPLVLLCLGVVELLMALVILCYARRLKQA